MPGKKIDEKVRQEVIKAYESGVPRTKIVQQFGISRSSVGRIVSEKVPKHKRRRKRDDQTERQKKIEELERRIIELEKKILEYESRKGAQ